MSDLRIVYLTQWWPDRITDTVQVGIAQALRGLGPVYVVTGPPLELRSNQVLDGRPWIRHESTVMGPFPVVRHSFYPGHGSSAVKRMAMYGTFAASSIRSVGPVWKTADVCVVYGSPMTATTAATVGVLLRGTPYVCIVQDMWPDAILASGIMRDGHLGRLVTRTMNAITDQYYRHASRIVVISEGMKELLVQRGVPGDKIRVIFNWDSEHTVTRPVFIPQRAHGDPLHVMYAGNFGASQGLDGALEAFARLPRDRFTLTLLGGGAEEARLSKLAVNLGLHNVSFAGRRPQAEMPRELARAQVHLVSLRPDPVFNVTIPHKIQSLMAAGVPIVGSLSGEPAAIIERADAGWVAPAGDPASLAHLLVEIEATDPGELTRRGRSGRDYYFQEMSRAVGEARLREVVNEALTERRRGR